ncbi:MAG: JAB domain-containing protein [Eubacterium sp.]|nr:JAB domain-containing protein [Eubacterium sp.]
MKEHRFRQVDVRFSKKYLENRWNDHILDCPAEVNSFVSDIYKEKEEVYAIIGMDSALHPRYMTVYTKEQLLEEREHPDRIVKTAVLNNVVNVCAAHIMDEDFLTVQRFGVECFMKWHEEDTYSWLNKVFGTFLIKLTDIVQVYPDGIANEFRSYIHSLDIRHEYTSMVFPKNTSDHSAEMLPKDIGIELYTLPGTSREVRTPEEAITYLGEKLSGLPREAVYIVNLGKDYVPESYVNLSLGRIGDAPIDMRCVYQTALLTGAEAVMIIHNHPSGNIDPSDSDFTMTRTVSKCGTMLGIPLFDSVIVSSGFRAGSKFRSIRAYAPTLFDTEISTGYRNCIDSYESGSAFSQVAELSVD